MLSKVYPVGIPALYASILWKNRELLNPRIQTVADDISPGATEEELAAAAPTLRSAAQDQTKEVLCPLEVTAFNERVRARKEHPDLAPSAFLWRDFGEGLCATG